jgi:hypothetical protein
MREMMRKGRKDEENNMKIIGNKEENDEDER